MADEASPWLGTFGVGHKRLRSDNLNQEAFSPVFGDFEDMYIDFYRFISIGAILSSPVVDKGVVYVGSMDGNLYALQ